MFMFFYYYTCSPKIIFIYVVLSFESNYILSILDISFTFPSIKVWTQGGYEPDFGTEEKFQKCCDSNPTLLHGFMEPCISFNFNLCFVLAFFLSVQNLVSRI